jgi:hypothetical protein
MNNNLIYDQKLFYFLIKLKKNICIFELQNKTPLSFILILINIENNFFGNQRCCFV